MSERGHDRAVLEDQLARYVRQTIFGDKPLDSTTLARLVAAAPARHVLTPDEWWNVALILAYRIRDAH